MTGGAHAWLVAAVLGVAAVSCGTRVVKNGDVAVSEPQIVEEPQAVEEARATEVCQVDKRFCKTRDRFWGVRAEIYGPPFTESPEEIQALMAESDALLAEWERLAPDEIRSQIEFILAESTHPIDAMTEQLGWDPYAAINTPEALAIFADPEIAAMDDEIQSFMERCCPVEEDLAVPTDPLILGDRTIAVYNGTPSLNEALAWGLSRFEMAGLEVPPIGSVTFTVQSAMCDDIRGRYRPTAMGIELELCIDEQTACWEDPAADPDICAGHCPAHVPGVLAVVLHEIAHAWLDANVDSIDTDQFLEHVELEVWRDRDVPWDQNGHEHAADTIAWGLMDRDIEMLRIGQPIAEELARGFRVLTGIDPLPKNESRALRNW